MEQSKLQGQWLLHLGIVPREQVVHAWRRLSDSPEQDLCGLLLAEGLLAPNQAWDIRARASQPPPDPASLSASTSGAFAAVSQPSALRHSQLSPESAVAPAVSSDASPRRPTRPASQMPRPASAGGPAIAPTRPPTHLRSGSKLGGTGYAAGDAIAGYELIEELGRGGMGVVFEARRRSDDAQVALKLMRIERKQDRVALERFEIEAQTMQRLRHPNIVRVLDVGKGDDHAYMAMELIRGGSLADRIDERGPLPPLDAARIAAAIGQALHHAHGRAIIHRDLKPANILLDPQGRPLLTDFGLAKALDATGKDLSKTGEFVGTLAYMPPEQANGDHHLIDARSDVYALGVTLFEMLTGQTPFTQDTQLELMRAVLLEEAPAPSAVHGVVPRELDPLVLRCLAKRMDQRPASALAVSEDCLRFTRSEPLAVQSFSRRERWQQWRARNPVLAKVLPAAAALLLLTVGVAGVWVQRAAYRAELRAEEDKRRAALEKAEALEASQKAAEAAQSEAEFRRNQAVESLAEARRAREKAEAALGRAEAARLEAERARVRAEAAEADAQERITEGLLEKADSELRNHRWGEAAVLSAEALARLPGEGPQRERAEALLGLARLRAGWLWRSPGSLRFPAQALAADPRGRWLAATEQRGILIWELGSGRLVARLDGHADIVQSLAFSSDGARLVSGDRAGVCILWEVEAGAEVQRWEGHSKPVMALAFAPGDRLIASAALDNRVRLRDVEKAWQAGEVNFGVAATGLAILPDGARFVVALTSGVIALCETATQTVTERITTGLKVTALALSPDGQRLAAGAEDGQLALYHISTKARTRSLSGGKGRFTGLAFSPDGAWLAGASEAGLGLWSSADDGPSEPAQQAPGRAFAAAFVDREQLAIAREDRSLELRRLPDLSLERAVSGHAGAIRGLALIAGTLYSAGQDGQLRAWELASGAPRGRHRDAELRFDALAAAPGELHLVSTNGQLWSVDPETLKARRRPLTRRGPKDKAASTEGGGEAAAKPISEEGRQVAPIGEKGLLVTTASSRLLRLELSAAPGKQTPGQELGALTGTPQRLAVSPDGEVALIGLKDGRVEVWDLRKGERARTLRAHGEALNGLVAHPDPREPRFATCSADGTLRVWDRSSGRELLRIEGHQSQVTDLAYSPDGSRLISASADSSVRVWVASSGEEEARLTGLQQAPTALLVSADGRFVAAGTEAGLVRVWSISEGRERARATVSSPGDGLASAGGLRLALRDGALVELRSGEAPRRICEVPGGPRSLAASAACADGPCAAIGFPSGRVELRALSDGRILRELPKAHEDIVHALAFSADGATLLTGSEDATARLFDVATGVEREALKHPTPVTAVTWLADWSVATGTRAGAVRSWDGRMGRLERIYEGHQGAIRALAADPAQGLLVSASEDRQAIRWERDTGAILQRFVGHLGGVTALLLLPDRGWLATGSRDRSLRLWELASGREVWSYEGHRGAVMGLALEPLPEGVAAPARLMSLSRDATLRTWDASLRRPEAPPAASLRREVQSLSGLRAQGFRTLPDPNRHLIPASAPR